MLYRLARHPRTPWTVRFVAGVAVAYLMSPVQLLPNFIPVLGQADDLLLVWCATKFARLLTPQQILIECAACAEPSAEKDA